MLKFRHLMVLLLAAAAAPASAQMLPDVGGAVGGVLERPLNEIGQAAGDVTDRAVEELRAARETAQRQLRRRHPDLIDQDRNGDIVVRSEVLAMAPSAEALATARARGFSERETLEAGELGLRIVVLTAPAGMSTRRAVETLRGIDPAGAYEYNHIYLGSGAEQTAPKQAHSHGAGAAARIGLIDSGVDADHPALAGASLQQRGFAGATIVGAHGTAIGAILIGENGAAPGASLYVADVYGGRPTGGGATAIVSALNWLVQSRVAVINISLVGPSNRALEAAISAALERGVVIVAAVGNDGPASPPLYPAASPGVIGVTGVDARNRVLPEAVRGEQVDFSAPGSDFTAASPSGGYVRVRGTSYAAPIVAGLIAQRLNAPDAASAQRAEAALAAAAVDLGARGRDRVFGLGLVGQDFRNDARVARR